MSAQELTLSKFAELLEQGVNPNARIVVQVEGGGRYLVQDIVLDIDYKNKKVKVPSKFLTTHSRSRFP